MRLSTQAQYEVTRILGQGLPKNNLRVKVSAGRRGMDVALAVVGTAYEAKLASGLSRQGADEIRAEVERMITSASGNKEHATT